MWGKFFIQRAVRRWHCCPELWVPHPWRCPRPWMGPVQPELLPHVVADNPACGKGAGIRLSFEIPSDPSHSVVLEPPAFAQTVLFRVCNDLPGGAPGLFEKGPPSYCCFPHGPERADSVALQSPTVLDHAPRHVLKPYNFTACGAQNTCRGSGASDM